MHLKKYRYSCDICGEKFSATRNVQWHKQSVHRDKTPEESANKTPQTGGFGDILKFLRTAPPVMSVSDTLQIKANTGGPCPYCRDGRFYKNLRSHIEVIHFKKKRYQCSLCGEGFVATKNLKQHIRGAHPEMYIE